MKVRVVKHRAAVISPCEMSKQRRSPSIVQRGDLEGQRERDDAFFCCLPRVYIVSQRNMLSLVGVAIVSALLTPRLALLHQPARVQARCPCLMACSSHYAVAEAGQPTVDIQPLPSSEELSRLSRSEWIRISHDAHAAGHWHITAKLASEAAALENSRSNHRHSRLPVEELFSVAIDACANATQWRQSVDLLRELEASGRTATFADYDATMRACRDGGEWRVGVLLLRRARTRGDLAPMVDLYAHAIGGCEDAGKSEDGVHLYALGVEDGVFSHWHAEEPFSLDLHGFSQPTAAMAVRYVLQRELANYLPSDLKIITGRGSHSEDGVSRLLPRIERLLSDELDPPVPFDHAEKLICDATGCKTVRNDGCLVVQVQDLFQWMVHSKQCDSYYVSIPAMAA